jgi:hypothetical protein
MVSHRPSPKADDPWSLLHAGPVPAHAGYMGDMGDVDVHPPVVVLPPESGGGRRVTIDDELMGTAYSLFDVLDFLHRAGLPTEDRAVDDPELIEWRGGGPYVWNNTP